MKIDMNSTGEFSEEGEETYDPLEFAAMSAR